MSTGANVTSMTGIRAFEFSGLESYTRIEAALSNWRQQYLGGADEWKAWIQDAWGDLLLAPAGLEVGLTQSHSVETPGEGRQYTFKQREILIGRDAASDVVLDTVAAGKRHARIVVEQGRCYLEDLGSSLGTYWNQTRVAPNQRRLLQVGDQVAIFPYVFAVSLRQLWARQLDVGVYAGAAESMTWRGFLDTSTRGRTSFTVSIHPIGASVCLEVSRSFLMEMADRILRPLEIGNPASVLGPTDGAFFEFLILCLIERANRDLAFPFLFEAGPADAKPSIPSDAKGVCLACSVSLLTTTGALRVFLPYRSIEAMRTAAPPRDLVSGASPIAWSFPVSVGSVELSAKELSGLERDDVLIPSPEIELLLPQRFDRGWKASAEDDSSGTASDMRNLRRLRNDKYFEREPLTNEDTQPANSSGAHPTPDLSQLPVRVHVILADKEMTLPEASGLTRGAIVDLDCEKTGVVSLAVNGRVLGQGQLVDVEGRLGVRVLSWRGA
jgi:type III secretion system YscQ/HrcQ family protein